MKKFKDGRRQTKGNHHIPSKCGAHQPKKFRQLPNKCIFQRAIQEDKPTPNTFWQKDGKYAHEVEKIGGISNQWRRKGDLTKFTASAKVVLIEENPTIVT